MIVNEPGHLYIVKNYDVVPDDPIRAYKNQNIKFFKRLGDNYPGNSGQPYEGTNCQELLRVLIDRVKYLNNQKPCAENEDILAHLRESLFLFEFRANAMHDYDPPNVNIEKIENYPTCETCGHIECQHAESNK